MTIDEAINATIAYYDDWMTKALPNYIGPLRTALIFTGFAMLVDFFVVALLILRSLDMFASLLGTWIPFALIFISTYLTGLVTVGSIRPKIAAG